MTPADGPALVDVLVPAAFGAALAGGLGCGGPALGYVLILLAGVALAALAEVVMRLGARAMERAGRAVWPTREERA